MEEGSAMIGWIVFGITFTSHLGLIYVYEKERRKLDNLRSVIKSQARTIRDMESQLRMASRRFFQ